MPETAPGRLQEASNMSKLCANGVKVVMPDYTQQRATEIVEQSSWYHKIGPYMIVIYTNSVD